MKNFLIKAAVVATLFLFPSCIKDDPPSQPTTIGVTVDALNDVDGGTITFE